VAEVIAFMGEHREEFGVEPMCRVLNIAPSTWHAHAAQKTRPNLRSKRSKEDEKLCAAILRVHAENVGVYGARPRRPPGRRCSAVGSRRLLARDGLAPASAGGPRHRPRPGGAADAPSGARRRPPRKARANDAQRQDGLCPLDKVNRRFTADRPNRPLPGLLTRLPPEIGSSAC
jgi:putative transposase